MTLLHQQGLVHTDLKMDNIMMARPAHERCLQLKLADLGSCISVTGTDTTRITFEMQTLPYRAPEVCRSLSLTFRCRIEQVFAVWAFLKKTR